MNKFLPSVSPAKPVILGSVLAIALCCPSFSAEGLQTVRADQVFPLMLEGMMEREKEIARERSAPPSPAGEGSGPSGPNVLLVFDVSQSVVRKSAKSGLPMAKIGEETKTLIDALSPNSRFNVIQFTRNYAPFSKTMLPADEGNREALGRWIDARWSEKGSMRAEGGAVKNPEGILGVLDFAKGLKPDLVYIISDGSFHKGKPGVDIPVTFDELGAAVKSLAGPGRKVPVNFVAFAPNDEEKQGLRKLALSTGGQLTEIRN